MNQRPRENATPEEREELSVQFTKQDQMATVVDVSTPGPTRETWGSKIDFLLSIIGFAVDLANVWRFPYLVYSNGGGAFLIPYFLMLIFGAVPLFYMELILGQYHREGAISVWKICPLFKGIGVCQNIISYVVAFYYNVIIAWCFYYLFSSFRAELPWMSCDNEFNTRLCNTMEESRLLNVLRLNASRFNTTLPLLVQVGNKTLVNGQLASAEYFERGVLGIHSSSGISDIGLPRGVLVGCCVLVFILLYFSLWKGVKSSGKVVYVTATMPYIILSILLVNGALLDGSRKGVEFFITPDFRRLRESKVWVDAAVQIFYSAGAGFGTHIAYASYNPRENNCYRDCLITAAVNSCTSLFAGFVVFCYLGYMSVLTGRDIAYVVNEGPGLVFQVYPIAVGSLAAAPFWSCIFFILLITLGLDSSMGGMESVLTGIKDEFKNLFARHKYSREIFTLVAVFVAFLMSLVIVTDGGIYIFTMLDKSAGPSLLWAALFQAIAVAWFYGLDQFCADVKEILGFTPGLFWRICWKYISPIFLIGILVFTFVETQPLAYSFGAIHPEIIESMNGSVFDNVYLFPKWADILCWHITGIEIIMVPLFAIIMIIKYKSFYLAVSPIWEHESILKGYPAKRKQLRHWFSLGGESDSSLPSDSITSNLCTNHLSNGDRSNAGNSTALTVLSTE